MKKLLIGLLIIASFSFAGNITKNGMNQGDIYTILDNLVKAELYAPLGRCVLTKGAQTTVNTTTTINFYNNGKIYTLAPSTNIKLVKVDLAAYRFYRSSAASTVNFGVHINSAGTKAVVNRADGANTQPGYVSGYTPIGVIEVGLTSTNTAGFLVGTTSWGAPSQNVVVHQVGKFNAGKNKLSLIGL